MAQSAIQSPTDVVDFLVGQHRQIKGLFDQTWPTCWRGRSRQCSTAPATPSSVRARPAIPRRAIYPNRCENPWCRGRIARQRVAVSRYR